MASKSKDTRKTSKKKVAVAKKSASGSKSAAVNKITRPCDKFTNRELSWLEFNNRILHEARDTKNPLLERLNFRMK